MKIVLGDYYFVSHPNSVSPILVKLDRIQDNTFDPQEFVSLIIPDMSCLDDPINEIWNEYWHSKTQILIHFGNLKTFKDDFPEYWI